MIAEFDWLSSCFLGVLTEKNSTLKQNLELKKQTLIWYPASFDCPTDQFEPVIVGPELKINNLEGDIIQFHSLRENKLQSFGFELIPNVISNYESFHDWIITKIKMNENDKCINKRKIFYLDTLTQLNFSLLESKIQFDSNVIDKIKKYLKTDDLELWNAFVSYIPLGLVCPDQVIHRDCLYDSISLFFYLDDSTDPKTQFFPFSHRLVLCIENGLSVPFIPDLKKGDVFLMDGKLFHGGVKGETSKKDRLLYVFQYRDKNETRSSRAKNIKKLQDLAQKDLYKTIFKAR